MHFRTRLKLRAVPVTLTFAATLVIIAIGLAQSLTGWLERQQPMLPEMLLGAASLVPVAFACWYLCSYAEIHRGRLRLRGFRGTQDLDLRSLVEAELYSRGTSTRHTDHDLLLRLRDSRHAEIWLPLSCWRDEDLLMAMVLRAAVDRKVRIAGDPPIVARFSGLLDSYKSWDRQLAA